MVSIMMYKIIKISIIINGHSMVTDLLTLIFRDIQNFDILIISSICLIIVIEF